MKYYLVVGEASGDMHASKLIQGIQKSDPDAQFRFWGGERMAEVAGAENMVSHYRDGAVMGFIDVVKNYRKIATRMRKCKSDMLAYAPDVVILVDFAGFNLPMAKHAKKHGFKTFFYIAPKVWAWKEYRVKKIRRWVDELFVIFPFEVDYFTKKGISTHYCGNPIMDELEQHHGTITPHDQFIRENDLGDKPIVALLAGSRRGEIEKNLPFMNKVANTLPDYHFVVAGVPWLDRALYDRVIASKAPNLQLVIDKTYDTLYHSEAAIVTSGTATLETALIGTPEMVCYGCSSLTYDIMEKVLKVRYISLVNIIMNKPAVTELISSKFMTLENATSELKAILPGGSRRETIKADYAELLRMMGTSGASDRFGKLMVKLLNKE